jgi:hypothetical protein
VYDKPWLCSWKQGHALVLLTSASKKLHPLGVGSGSAHASDVKPGVIEHPVTPDREEQTHFVMTRDGTTDDHTHLTNMQGFSKP